MSGAVRATGRPANLRPGLNAQALRDNIHDLGIMAWHVRCPDCHALRLALLDMLEPLAERLDAGDDPDDVLSDLVAVRKRILRAVGGRSA